MKLPIFQVDSFTNIRFKGNPAAVVPLGEWLGRNLMQKIASENNLAETAFFVKEENNFHIRWFTPLVEVDLCGHATLAAAAVAFEKLGYKKDEILFNSRSGMLRVKKEEDEYTLDFPADIIEKTESDPKLIKAIGIPPNEIYKGKEDYLLIYSSEQDLLKIEPDFRELSRLTQRGVIVSAPGNTVDFVSRFFAPAAGINEDPVTGSAHTTMVPYWSEKLGKKELSATQISKRGGDLMCRHNNDRVEISGKVAFYLEGIIEL
jgi:PhzF family phenazine biosynthesis protein